MLCGMHVHFTFHSRLTSSAWQPIEQVVSCAEVHGDIALPDLGRKHCNHHA